MTRMTKDGALHLARTGCAAIVLSFMPGCEGAESVSQAEPSSGSEGKQTSGEVAATSGALRDLADPDERRVDDALKDPNGAAAGFHRDSIACDEPAGGKVKYSWSNAGAGGVTVHFDNPCAHEVRAGLVYEKDGQVRVVDCLRAPSGARGEQRVPHEPMRGYFLREVEKGC